jgi:hypothetical protein
MITFASAAEPFEAQALVAEFAIEAFRNTILPRFARLDQRRADILRASQAARPVRDRRQ